jgi:hypothetical protein
VKLRVKAIQGTQQGLLLLRHKTWHPILIF